MKKVVTGKSVDEIMLFPIVFYDEMNRSVDERNAVDVIYLAFSKALENLRNILLSKVQCYGLHCWTNGRVNNWLDDQAQKGVINESHYLEAANKWTTM